MNILDKIIYGGTSKLTKLERSLFESLIEKAQNTDSKVFAEQIKNIRLIQKLHHNKIIEYHLKSNCESLLSDKRLDLVYAEFKYKLSCQNFSSRLIVSAGKISSLETTTNLSKNMLKMSCEDCECNIKLTKETTLGEEINRNEHDTEE